MGRPGVMFYFDTREGLRLLPPEQRFAVYEAILDYGEYGVIPEFSDPVAQVVWSMIRPRLDKDNAAYERRLRKPKRTQNDTD